MEIVRTSAFQKFTTREEFIRDAVRWRLQFLREDYEYIEIPREECEKVQHAIRDMDLPFLSVERVCGAADKEFVGKVC